MKSMQEVYEEAQQKHLAAFTTQLEIYFKKTRASSLFVLQIGIRELQDQFDISNEKANSVLAPHGYTYVEIEEFDWRLQKMEQPQSHISIASKRPTVVSVTTGHIPEAAVRGKVKRKPDSDGERGDEGNR